MARRIKNWLLSWFRRNPKCEVFMGMDPGHEEMFVVYFCKTHTAVFGQDEMCPLKGRPQR